MTKYAKIIATAFPQASERQLARLVGFFTELVEAQSDEISARGMAFLDEYIAASASRVSPEVLGGMRAAQAFLQELHTDKAAKQAAATASERH